jgi:putative membrane protein
MSSPFPQADREPDPRFTLANERTLLAWNRTALALIGGALAIAQFLHNVSRAARLLIAVPMLALAIAVTVTGYARWRANQRALRRGAPLPSSSLPIILTVGIATVALTTAGIVLVAANR